jgi:hypothetical protein
VLVLFFFLEPVPGRKLSQFHSDLLNFGQCQQEQTFVTGYYRAASRLFKPWLMAIAAVVDQGQS